MSSDLLATISQSLDASKIAEISRQIGAEPSQTKSALSAALPMLVSGLAKNASSTEGAQSLAGALDRDHDGSLLDSLGGLLGQQQQGSSGGLGAILGQVATMVTDAPGPGSAKSADGAGILGHIFGSKQQPVENGVAKASGLSGSQVASLLVTLAPIVMAALGRTKQKKGLDAGGLTDLLQQESSTMGGGAAGGILGSLLGGDSDDGIADGVAKAGLEAAAKNILGNLFG
ncbi:MAG: DUF937 domain-containing protein [Myxococcota bacterium]